MCTHEDTINVDERFEDGAFIIERICVFCDTVLYDRYEYSQTIER